MTFEKMTSGSKFLIAKHQRLYQTYTYTYTHTCTYTYTYTYTYSYSYTYSFTYTHMYIYIYLPGTQMTLVLIGKGLVLGGGWPSKIGVIWVLGIHICAYIAVPTNPLEAILQLGHTFPLNAKTQLFATEQQRQVPRWSCWWRWSWKIIWLLVSLRPQIKEYPPGN